MEDRFNKDSPSCNLRKRFNTKISLHGSGSKHTARSNSEVCYTDNMQHSKEVS